MFASITSPPEILSCLPDPTNASFILTASTVSPTNTSVFTAHNTTVHSVISMPPDIFRQTTLLNKGLKLPLMQTLMMTSPLVKILSSLPPPLFLEDISTDQQLVDSEMVSQKYNGGNVTEIPWISEKME
ncbi:hypothetical protein HD554DRAFT_2040301 [Boletus coccyginus]|nr:hypothetical protein HD554DRAFT_2040301 [Boletus coccyginus]